jgi:catalase
MTILKPNPSLSWNRHWSSCWHDDTAIPVDKAAPNAPSVIYDAVFIPGGPASVATLVASPLAVDFVKEAYLHCKPIAAMGEAIELLAKAQIAIPSDDPGISSERGIVTTRGRDGSGFAKAFIRAIAAHRHFDRQVEM